MPALRLSTKQKAAISAAARKAGLDFIRLFGSATQSLSAARDLDLAVGSRPLSLAQLSLLVSAFEKIFNKPVDVVQLGQLRRGSSPWLIKEIGARSIALWEKPKSGRSAYVESIEPLLAIAEDEILAFPKELKRESLRLAQRRLRVS